MTDFPRASDALWERVREARQDVIFDRDGSKPDAVVTDACQREAGAIAVDYPVKHVANSLEWQAHERGLLQRCPDLFWSE